MKSLWPLTGHPLLQAAFGKPVACILPENSPEYIKTHYIASDHSPIDPIIRWELGLNPGSTTTPRWHDHIPDMQINELSGVLLYNGALYSRSGGVFPESFRIFDKNYCAKFLYNYRDQATLRRLGKKHFIPQRSFKVLKQVLQECEEILLPFFTLQPVYGHWLLEAVSSLWAWDEVCRLAGGRRPKLLLSPVREVPAYVKALCLPFGITEDDYFFPSSSCMLLDRIFLPTRAYMHMAYVSSMAKAVWNRITSHYDKLSSLRGIDKIFVSRSRVTGRKLLNEIECEEFFTHRGFTSIHPQELSLADQIHLFAEAHYIAGPVGSAVHNVVFSRHPGKLQTLFLAPRDFASLSAISVIEQGYGRKANFVYGSERKKNEPNVWNLDVKNLEKAVAQWLNKSLERENHHGDLQQKYSCPCWGHS